MRWEYNPERAKQLLAEAGYPDGFSITLTPSLRGAPVEVEACEAIASMWTDIGVDVNFQKVPYGTLRPTIVGTNVPGALPATPLASAWNRARDLPTRARN